MQVFRTNCKEIEIVHVLYSHYPFVRLGRKSRKSWTMGWIVEKGEMIWAWNVRSSKYYPDHKTRFFLLDDLLLPLQKGCSSCFNESIITLWIYYSQIGENWREIQKMKEVRSLYGRKRKNLYCLSTCYFLARKYILWSIFILDWMIFTLSGRKVMTRKEKMIIIDPSHTLKEFFLKCFSLA